MTCTIIVHNGPGSHVDVIITTRDQIYDHEAKKMTNEWKDQPIITIEPGVLYQGYATTTRQVVVSEVPREPLLGKAHSTV